jgi:ABC-type nitrate/sulfonate/bicarbonate transport system substrate-binding protein
MCPVAGTERRRNHVVQALMSGRADYTNVLASSLLAAFRGAPLTCVAIYQVSGWELWAHADVADLHAMVGRTVASASPLVWAVVESALRAAGVDPARIGRGPAVGLDASAVAAVVGRQVDAVLLVSPATIEAARAGFRCLLRLDGRDQVPTYGLMTTRARFACNREEAARLARAVGGSIEQLRADPQLARALMRELGTSEEVAAAAVEDGLRRFVTAGMVSETVQRRCLTAARSLPDFDESASPSSIFDASALQAAGHGALP